MKTITYNPETHVLVPREPNPNRCAGCSPDNCSGCGAAPVYQVCMADSVSLSGAWIDVDKQTYHDAGLYKEYKLRALYTTPQPDRTAELEAALKVAKAALNRAADKFHDYAEIHAAKEASPENDLKVERNLMLSSDMDKALAKINEVLKP